MQKLLVRAISGVVYASIIIGSILYAKESFYFVFYLFMLICLYEFKNLISLSYKWTIVVATIIFFSATNLGIVDAKYLNALFVLSFFIPIIYQLFKQNISLTTSKLGHYFLALAYIAFPFALLIQIPFINNEYHPKVIIGVFLLIWISDTFAYLVGSAIGKTKLYEKVSPNKTIEGALGGLIFAVISAYFISKYIPILSLLNWLIVASIVVIFGILGDLIESKFKREANVKDSSNFIPGHGGFLDRLDSVIFTAPFIYLYLHITT